MFFSSSFMILKIAYWLFLFCPKSKEIPNFKIELPILISVLRSLIINEHKKDAHPHEFKKSWAFLTY